MIDWAADDIGDWLTPLADHLNARARSAYGSGAPVVARRWRADTIKAAIADERVGRLSEAMPDVRRPRGQPAAQPAAGPRLAPRRTRRRASPPASPGSSSSCRSPASTAGAVADRDEPAVAAQHQEGRQARRAGQPGRRRGPARVPPALHRDRRAGRVHAAAAELLPDHVRRTAGGGPGPDPAVSGPPRRRPGRGHHLGPGRRARLVLLRSQLDGQAGGARLERDPVADDHRRVGGRGAACTTCAASPRAWRPTIRTSV